MDYNEKAKQEYLNLIQKIEKCIDIKDILGVMGSKKSGKETFTYNLCIGFGFESKFANWLNDQTFKKIFEFGRYDKIGESSKTRDDLDFERAKMIVLESLMNNSSEKIPIIKKRLQQIDNQNKKKEENQAKKKESMQKCEQILKSNGFQVSKVHIGWNGYETRSYERSLPDKWHKYLDTNGMPNVKFATVEVKINLTDIKFGVKMETRGQIGCEIEEFEKIYQLAKQETEKIKAELV